MDWLTTKAIRRRQKIYLLFFYFNYRVGGFIFAQLWVFCLFFILSIHFVLWWCFAYINSFILNYKKFFHRTIHHRNNT
jgi:hypothetical protein